MKAFLSGYFHVGSWSGAQQQAINEAKRILAETEDFPGSGLCYQGDLNLHVHAYHPEAYYALIEALAEFIRN